MKYVGRGARRRVALTDDDDRIGADVFGHLCRHDGFEFASADKSGFQLLAVQHDFVKFVETASAC